MVKHTFRNKRKHKKTLKRKTQKRKFTITNPLNGNKYIVYPFKKLWGGEMVDINGFKYDDKNKLGQGAFGTVYEAIKAENDNTKYAIKVINTNHNNEEDIKNEIHILQYIKRTNNNNCRNSIICIEDSFIDNNNNYYIVTELFNKEQYSELFDFNFTGLNDNVLAKIISNICKTVYELHKINIAHRDIKLENFMIDKTNYNVKILDFGLACLISENIGECKDVVGTLEYIDPVLTYNTRMYGRFRDKNSYPINLKSGDLWSLGILIFEIIAKTIRFDKNDTDVSKLKDIWIKDITFNLDNLFSNKDEYNNFIKDHNNSVIVNSLDNLPDSSIKITNNLFYEINKSYKKKKYTPYNIINNIHINLNTLMSSLFNKDTTDININLLKKMINTELYNKISDIIEYYWFVNPITYYYEPKISTTTSTNGFQNYLIKNIYNENEKATDEEKIAKQIFDKSITINQICKANNWHRAKLINLLDYNINKRHITSPSIVSTSVSKLKTVFGITKPDVK